MKNTILLPVFLLFSIVMSAQVKKMPAYPLITHDPYFSIWSFTDDLTAGSTKHWTGADQPMTGWCTVDGQNYRFMGEETSSAATAQWKGVTVTATRTIYQYACGPVNLQVQFTSPLL